MDRETMTYTHLDYRSAKIIHLIEEGGVERFIYKRHDISHEEADAITACFLEAKEQRRMKKDLVLEKCLK